MAEARMSLPVVRHWGETRRRDLWWVQPAVVFVVLGTFIVYATWAAFQGNNYTYGPYLSPDEKTVTFTDESQGGGATYSVASRSVDGKVGFKVPFVEVELGGGRTRGQGAGQRVTVVFGGPVDEQGLTDVQFRRIVPSLEDVFIGLVRKEEAAHGG